MDDGAARAVVCVDVALRVVLRAGEEGELLSAGDGAADGAAGIDIAVVRAREAVVVGEPVV